MRELVERQMAGGRRVTVNLAESPLGWLRARGMVSDRQYAAGEQLRTDYETAQLPPRVTMRWDTVRVDGGGAGGTSPTARAVSARARFGDAVASAGPGLSDILWRVVCAGEAVPVAEKALGWPARSGRLVLGFALDRVADHYRLG